MNAESKQWRGCSAFASQKASSMKFLVTAQMEFYQWIEAPTAEDVSAFVDAGQGTWHQTLNQPLTNIKIKPVEVETTGEEIKDSKSNSE